MSLRKFASVVLSASRRGKNCSKNSNIVSRCSKKYKYDRNDCDEILRKTFCSVLLLNLYESICLMLPSITSKFVCKLTHFKFELPKAAWNQRLLYQEKILFGASVLNQNRNALVPSHRKFSTFLPKNNSKKDSAICSDSERLSSSSPLVEYEEEVLLTFDSLDENVFKINFGDNGDDIFFVITNDSKTNGPPFQVVALYDKDQLPKYSVSEGYSESLKKILKAEPTPKNLALNNVDHLHSSLNIVFDQNPSTAYKMPEMCITFSRSEESDGAERGVKIPDECCGIEVAFSNLLESTSIKQDVPRKTNPQGTYVLVSNLDLNAESTAVAGFTEIDEVETQIKSQESADKEVADKKSEDEKKANLMKKSRSLKEQESYEINPEDELRKDVAEASEGPHEDLVEETLIGAGLKEKIMEVLEGLGSSLVYENHKIKPEKIKTEQADNSADKEPEITQPLNAENVESKEQQKLNNLKKKPKNTKSLTKCSDENTAEGENAIDLLTKIEQDSWHLTLSPKAYKTGVFHKTADERASEVEKFKLLNQQMKSREDEYVEAITPQRGYVGTTQPEEYSSTLLNDPLVTFNYRNVTMTSENQGLDYMNEATYGKVSPMRAPRKKYDMKMQNAEGGSSNPNKNTDGSSDKKSEAKSDTEHHKLWSQSWKPGDEQPKPSTADKPNETFNKNKENLLNASEFRKKYAAQKLTGIPINSKTNNANPKGEKKEHHSKVTKAEIKQVTDQQKSQRKGAVEKDESKKIKPADKVEMSTKVTSKSRNWPDSNTDAFNKAIDKLKQKYQDKPTENKGSKVESIEVAKIPSPSKQETPKLSESLMLPTKPQKKQPKENLEKKVAENVKPIPLPQGTALVNPQSKENISKNPAKQAASSKSQSKEDVAKNPAKQGLKRKTALKVPNPADMKRTVQVSPNPGLNDSTKRLNTSAHSAKLQKTASPEKNFGGLINNKVQPASSMVKGTILKATTDINVRAATFTEHQVQHDFECENKNLTNKNQDMIKDSGTMSPIPSSKTVVTPKIERKDNKQQIKTSKPEMLSLKTFADQAQKQQQTQQAAKKAEIKNSPLKAETKVAPNKNLRNQKAEKDLDTNATTKSSPEIQSQAVDHHKVSATCKAGDKISSSYPSFLKTGTNIDQRQKNTNARTQANNQDLQHSNKQNITGDKGTTLREESTKAIPSKAQAVQNAKPTQAQTVDNVKPSLKLGSDLKDQPTKTNNVQNQKGKESQDKQVPISNAGETQYAQNIILKTEEKIANKSPLQSVVNNLKTENSNLRKPSVETFETSVTVTSNPQHPQKQNQKAEAKMSFKNPLQAFVNDARSQFSKANTNQTHVNKTAESTQNNNFMPLDALKKSPKTEEEMIGKNPLLAVGTANQSQAPDPNNKQIQSCKEEEKINNQKPLVTPTVEGINAQKPNANADVAMRRKNTMLHVDDASNLPGKENKQTEIKSENLTQSKNLPIMPQKEQISNLDAQGKLLSVKETTERKINDTQQHQNKNAGKFVNETKLSPITGEQNTKVPKEENVKKMDKVIPSKPTEVNKAEPPKKANDAPKPIKPAEVKKSIVSKIANKDKLETVNKESPQRVTAINTNPSKETSENKLDLLDMPKPVPTVPKNSHTSRLMDLMLGRPVTPEKIINPTQESPRLLNKKVANSAVKEIKESLPGQTNNAKRPAMKIPITPELRAARNIAQTKITTTPGQQSPISKQSSVNEDQTTHVKQDEAQEPNQNTPKASGPSTSQVGTSKGAIRTVKPINKRQSFHTAQKFIPNLVPENPMRKMLMNNKSKTNINETSAKYTGRKWYSTKMDIFNDSSKKVTILFRRDTHSESAHKAKKDGEDHTAGQATKRDDDDEPEPYTSPYPSITSMKDSKQIAKHDRNSHGNAGSHFSSFKVQMPSSKIVNNFHSANERNSTYETTCNNPSFLRLNLNTNFHDYKNNDESLDEQYALNSRIPRESACVSYHRSKNSGQRVARGGHVIKCQPSIPVPLENFDEYVDEEKRKASEAQKKIDKQKKPIIDSKNLLRELTSHLRPETKSKKVVPLLTAADIKKKNESEQLGELEEEDYAENCAICDAGGSQKALSKKLLCVDSNNTGQQSHSYSTMMKRSMCEVSTVPEKNTESKKLIEPVPETARKFSGPSFKQIVAQHRAAIRKSTEKAEKDDYTSSLVNVTETCLNRTTWTYSNLRKDMAKDMSLGIASSNVEYAKQAARNRSMRMHINKELAQEDANAETQELTTYVVPRRKILNQMNKTKDKQMNPMLLNKSHRRSNQTLNIPEKLSAKTSTTSQKNSASRFDSLYYKASSSPEKSTSKTWLDYEELRNSV